MNEAERDDGAECYYPDNVALDSGLVLANTCIAYKTFGELKPGRDVVLIPTYYTGTHQDCAMMVGADRALNPDRMFIIIVNMLGNGQSSSPSNTPAPCGGADFPHVTVADNVRLQHSLVTDHLGIDALTLIMGWSMGAQQTYEWAARYPDMVETILPICGSARTSRHNQVFLEGVKAALYADATFNSGRYTQPPIAGLAAFGRVYCGWAYSQAFFTREGYRELGFNSIGELLDHWEKDHIGWDANDLLAMLATWQSADISAQPKFGGDLETALASIEAKAIVMPCATDLYFPPQDSQFEVSCMRRAQLWVLQSDWGHIAGSPRFDASSKTVVERAIQELLKGR